MKTRKWIAILLTIALMISLCSGAVFADEAGDSPAAADAAMQDIKAGTPQDETAEQPASEESGEPAEQPASEQPAAEENDSEEAAPASELAAAEEAGESAPEEPEQPASEEPETEAAEELGEQEQPSPDEPEEAILAEEANAVIQASKSSSETYSASGTTLSSGPANPRTPKTYYYDLNEDRYPTAVSWEYYGDYLQGVGILYPGDKLVIIPEVDPNPGKFDSHGNPGKQLPDENGQWKDWKVGDKRGPLRITGVVTVGRAIPHNYVTEVTVEDAPVIFNATGSGNSGISSYAVDVEADYPDHGASYWPAGSMVFIELPKYHPVEYHYYVYGEEITAPMTFDGENPEVIWAEDLSSSYNPIDGWKDVGPEFTIYHPVIPGYKFDSINVEWNSDKNFNPVRVSTAEDGWSSKWRFFYDGALDFNWSFDGKKHGDETKPIVINLNYQEARTVTLDAAGGTVDGKTRAQYTYYYRTQRSWRYWYYDRFVLDDHAPVRDGYVFEGWYADPEHKVLAARGGTGEEASDFSTYWQENGLFNKDGPENCSENITLYAGWAKSSAADIAGAAISGLEAKTFTGAGVTQNPTVTLSGKTLTNGKDYEVFYQKNVNVGTATIIIHGIGAYRGFAKSTFRINAMTVTPVITLSRDTFEYDGESHRPEYTVTFPGGLQLTEGTDYSVYAYSQTGAGQSSVRVYMRGNYTGSATANFTVTPKPLQANDFAVALDVSTYTYDGTEKKPGATVTYNGETIPRTISYENNTAAGTAKAIITLTGNYTGSKTVTFTIKPQSKKFVVTVDPEYKKTTYSSLITAKTVPYKVTFGGTEVASDNYTVFYKDNTKAGTAYVCASGTGAYAGYYGEDSFVIEPLDISGSEVTEIADQEWTGKAITPTVRMKLPDSYYYIYVSPDAEYYADSFAVTYKNNVAEGTATVTVSGKGNYKGSVSTTFKITGGGTAAVTGITLKDSKGTVSGTKISIEVPARSTEQLVPVIAPANAANQTVTWKSSNPAAATVNASTGLVTGVRIGKTTITATTADGKKTATCEVRVLFSDVVNKSKANFNAVYSLVDKGIIAGFDGKDFKPDDKCTRAQVVLFLWRAAGKPVPKSTKLSFKDATDIEKLAPDYKKAVLWGNEKGIVMGFTSGVNKGKFMPNDSCTRAQIVLFLYRYMKTPAVKNTKLTFKDAATIKAMASSYTNAILWAVEKKITTGYSDGTFKPNQTCTRGECATFIFRMLS